MHDRSGGKNSINLNFLKALIAESIPDAPDGYNKHKLIDELRKNVEQQNIQTSAFADSFSDLLDVAEYVGDLDGRGVAHVALLNCHALVGQILVETVGYHPDRPCYIDTMLNALRSIDSDVAHYVNGCYPSENHYIEKVLRTWYDSMAAEISNYIDMHGALPVNKAEVALMPSGHLASFIETLSESPNYKNVIALINENGRITREYLDKLSFNEDKMISVLLGYFRDIGLGRTRW
ncbi:hypothetical protein [Vibrio coralliirubri]|uniref:hypothetical protein n=1 Tax=Vibrio coralliirubri TaxID=1516159 RepID=UPI0022835513|nr:hypothetical protein [Vibrio coralliirubri]